VQYFAYKCSFGVQDPLERNTVILGRPLERAMVHGIANDQARHLLATAVQSRIFRLGEITHICRQWCARTRMFWFKRKKLWGS